MNWYAALVLIALLGLASIIYSRYEYQHPNSSTVQPAVGTTLYAGYSIEVCGKTLAPLAASVNPATAGVTTPGQGVLNVSPHTASQAGNNATLGEFFSAYPGAELSATVLKVPGRGSYSNGQVCAKGTPDAGKKGYVAAAVWPNLVATSGTPISGNPADHKIGARTLIAIGFVPKGTSLKRPPQTTADQVLGFSGTVVNGTTTTTTAPSTTSTTAPTSTTSTSAPTTTTTGG